jgi:hypothetical protein
VAKLRLAIDGEGGCHKTTLKVAFVLVGGWGLSIEDAWPYFCTWNQRCEPVWTAEELMHKLEDALDIIIEKGTPRGYLRLEGHAR